MTTFAISFAIYIYYIQPLVSNWIQGTSTLSLADYSIAAGYYNRTVFLLGGNVRKRRIMRYLDDTDTFTFTDPAFDIDMYGEGQFWSQRGHTVYMIAPSTLSTITTFDMTNEAFNSNWRTIPINVGTSGCLAYSESTNHLIVTGGHDGNTYLNTVQALDLSTSQWLENTSAMLDTRASHACIVNNHKLWVFGGYKGSYMSTNERIDVTNLVTNTWVQLSSSLTANARSACAVARNHKVYIIGGRNANAPHDWVHILDTNTEVITLSPDTLVYAVALASPVLIDDVISVFGGWIAPVNLPTNAWMYYVLPVENVTTGNPTSIDPSRSPSIVPTAVTVNPTTFPSSITVNPTTSPSAITVNPSTFPSRSPSVVPTAVTANPTTSPSAMPSDCHVGGVSISIRFGYDVTNHTNKQSIIKERLNNISRTIIGNLSNIYNECVVSTDYIVSVMANRTAIMSVRICLCDVEIETVEDYGMIEDYVITILQQETVFCVDINAMFVFVKGQNDGRSTTLIPNTTESDGVYIDESIKELNQYFIYIMIAAFFGALMFGVFLVIWYRQEVVLQAEVSSRERRDSADSQTSV